MQSPARRTSTGMLIATADVEDADAADMVGVFQSLLPGTPAGEARRRLARHGWNLQEALKGVEKEDGMRRRRGGGSGEGQNEGALTMADGIEPLPQRPRRAFGVKARGGGRRRALE